MTVGIGCTTGAAPIKPLGTEVPSNSVRNSQPRWLNFRGALQIRLFQIDHGTYIHEGLQRTPINQVPSENFI